MWRTIPAEVSVLKLWYGHEISSEANFAGVGVEQIPREGAAALVVGVKTIGDSVLHLQPHLVSCVEVEDDRLASCGLVGGFRCSD